MAIFEERLKRARQMTREIDEILRATNVNDRSEKAADLLEAARSSNTATRTLLRRASLDLEEV